MVNPRNRRNIGISKNVDISIKENIGIGSRQHRSISIGSYLLGDGSSILELENTLHNTIAHYNENFQGMTTFDDKLVASFSSLQSDIEKIGREDIQSSTETVEKIIVC